MDRHHENLFVLAYLEYMFVYVWSILVMWLGCRFLDTDLDDSNSGISVLCP